MIYLVTNNVGLQKLPFKLLSLNDCLLLLNSVDYLQFDTETTGRDCHVNNILCYQFGNREKNFQIVVDALTIDINLFKKILETKLIIGQNLKFDLKFLYKYKIIPNRIYDTMIVEQLLYLGYPPVKKGGYSYALDSIIERRIGIHISKEIRGQIIYRGLDEEVIKYAAKDVEYLEDIMDSQLSDCKEKGCLRGAKLECDFVPAIAYLEYCGIKLDVKKWQEKMISDKQKLDKCVEDLNNYVISNPLYKNFYIDSKNTLFGEELFPTICTIKWSSSKQVIEFFKFLGFNTKVLDKETKEEKDSVLKKVIKKQKGINDNFLKLYLDYSDNVKNVTSYGQTYIDSINPITNRIHTDFRQIGTESSRMSCGDSKKPNTDLAKYKGLNEKSCKYVQLQNLPSDEITRSCFIPEEGNLMCSCDYSALESRLGADIYQEEAMIKEYLEGSGDIHSLAAKAIFREELKDLSTKEIKKKRPDLRSKAKSPEFAIQFGGGSFAIADDLSISIEEAKKIEDDFLNFFNGIKTYKTNQSKITKKVGFVLINPITGHKRYWFNHDKWIKIGNLFTPEFWEDYRMNHKGKDTPISKMVSKHFKEGSFWERLTLNTPTQGTGIIILKDAVTKFFRWIVNNNLFDKVLICNLIHDEIVIEYPNSIPEVAGILRKQMEDSASIYCKSLPIPAEPAIGDHWIH